MVNKYRENADKHGEDGKGPRRLFGVGLIIHVVPAKRSASRDPYAAAVGKGNMAIR